MAAPAEQGGHIALLFRLRLGLVHIVADAGIALEIGADIGRRLALFNTELARQAEARNAIDDAEIDRLGLATGHRVHLVERHAEHLAGGHGVNVDAVAEGLAQRLDAADIGDDAQLDLRIIDRQQLVPLLGDEGAADAPPFLGADRDVLYVRVGRGEAPCTGRGHGEGGVDAPRLRVDLLHQRVGIGGFQLGELAPFQDFRRQVVLRGQRLQHLGTGGVGAGLALLAALQPQLVEQDLAELLGRADVELATGQLVDVQLILAHAAREILRQIGQHLAVHLDAGALHLADDRHQRAFHRLVQRQHLRFAQARLQQPVQPPGDVGILGGVLGCLVQRHLVEGDLILAAAGDLLEGDGLVVEMQLRQLIHAVAMQPAFQHVGDQHAVIHRCHLNGHIPVVAEDQPVIFHIVADLDNRGVLQHRLQQFQRALLVDLLRALSRGVQQIALIRAIAGPVPDRDVAGLACLDRQRDTDQLRRHRIQRGGLGIDRDCASFHGRLDPAFQIGFLDHRLIGGLLRGDLRRHGDAGRGLALLHLQRL